MAESEKMVSRRVQINESDDTYVKKIAKEECRKIQDQYRYAIKEWRGTHEEKRRP